MLTTLTSITAHTAMQHILLKTSPKIDANFNISEVAQTEADHYRSIASRLGLGEGQSITEWAATKNLIRGKQSELVEVEMTEEDRNTIIAILERDKTDKEEILMHHRQMNSVSNTVIVFQALVDVLQSAIQELSTKTIQE